MDYLKILEHAKEILSVPSPTGYTNDITKYLVDYSKKHDLDYEVLNTGTFMVTVKGESDEVLGICGHVDTLGAIVTQVKDDGSLKFEKIGGPCMPTYDGEYCTIHTRDGKKYSGTLLSLSPAIHVFNDSNTLPRDAEHMYVRLDEVVHSKEDTKKLGIENGDYISLDPKTVITPSGYIKSRFLDDKLSAAIMFALINDLKENNIIPKKTLKFLFTVVEEHGSGCSYIPPMKELLAVDMGCVGLHLEGSEEKVSICAKDSAGPYNYDMITKLVNLAKANNVNYCIDIFPYYSSDVSVAFRGGNNIKGALIGSGVQASHGMERSHINGVKATYDLLKLYVLN